MVCQKRKLRKFYSLKYGKPRSKSTTVAARNRKKKQQLEPRKGRNDRSYADVLNQSPPITSNQSRPINFIDHLRKRQRPPTYHNQKDNATTVPGTIKSLQHPKRKTEKPNPTPFLEPQETERFQNDYNRNEIATSIYYY